MGNSYTQRRTRMRRPPVCKSKKPEEKDAFPPTINLRLDWDMDVGGDDWSSFHQDVIGFRIAGTGQYFCAGPDEQGNTWVCQFTLKMTPDDCLIQVTVVYVDMHTRVMNGIGEPWPGTRPFVAGVTSLENTEHGAVGSWHYAIP